jgi:hypothetical protein
MRLERIWELEDEQFTGKLFKNAVFKGGVAVEPIQPLR